MYCNFSYAEVREDLQESKRRKRLESTIRNEEDQDDVRVSRTIWQSGRRREGRFM